jgi:hypothetical protein
MATSREEMQRVEEQIDAAFLAGLDLGTIWKSDANCWMLSTTIERA